VADEIPNIVIGRLPIYLRELVRLIDEKGQGTTSSHELGQRLGISSAQIRKDLSHFGEFGKQGTGYHIRYLVEQLRHILHLMQEWSMVLVGAGYLGHALAHYDGFQHRGFQIVRIFDNDPAKIGEVMNGIVVQDISELEAAVRQHHIKIAILTVPVQAAQDTTDCLIRAGVKAILSYAPIHLTAPPEVYISYSDPVIQLQQMAYYLPPELGLPKV
jgi:redox-sensing transcriptional repressor